MILNESLLQRQALPLNAKVSMSIKRIHEWYVHWNGKVYVSFSGGKDSTVLLHLVRKLYPEVPAVFFNTGIEFPEVIQFIRSTDNVIWIKPASSFKTVIEKYGYPVVSKENSQKIHEIRTTKSDKLLHKRLYGADDKYRCGKLPEKWKYLIDAPFKISPTCCDVFKKRPAKKFEKESGLHSFVGTMAINSAFRRQSYLRYGCNSYDGKVQSRPLSFWLEEDIWNYINGLRIPYSTIYDMGYKTTGCIYCMFGAHLEKEPNRFQSMKITHRKLYDYCINDLGLGVVLDTLGVNFK